MVGQNSGRGTTLGLGSRHYPLTHFNDGEGGQIPTTGRQQFYFSEETEIYCA